MKTTTWCTWCGMTQKINKEKCLWTNILPSPQLISSESSLQSGRPSQSRESETHSSLCWHANWSGLQRGTTTSPPPEGEMVTLLGVTSSSTRPGRKVDSYYQKQAQVLENKNQHSKAYRLVIHLYVLRILFVVVCLCLVKFWYLLCSRWFPHAGRRCVWTP